MEREKYFLNAEKYAKEIKELVNKYVNAKVFLFGSVVRKDYSSGLSDIDIAIVSNEFKDRNKKLMIYDLLFEKYFYSPFEFHLLTFDQWNFYLRFIKNDYIEII